MPITVTVWKSDLSRFRTFLHATFVWKWETILFGFRHCSHFGILLYNFPHCAKVYLFLVFEKGVSAGVKGFFLANFDPKGRLQINADQIQKPEPWWGQDKLQSHFVCQRCPLFRFHFKKWHFYRRCLKPTIKPWSNQDKCPFTLYATTLHISENRFLIKLKYCLSMSRKIVIKTAVDFNPS